NRQQPLTTPPQKNKINFKSYIDDTLVNAHEKSYQAGKMYNWFISWGLTLSTISFASIVL
ncbi:MAG: hypothetical protein WBI90_05475, partial [Acetomicrobium sp.]